MFTSEAAKPFERSNCPSSDAYYSSVVWAPDLKTLCRQSYRRMTGTTVEFYQLRNDKWVALQSPVTEHQAFPVGATGQEVFAEERLPKGRFLAESDDLEARSWDWRRYGNPLCSFRGEWGRGGCSFHSKVRRGGELESRQNAPALEKGSEQLEKEQ